MDRIRQTASVLAIAGLSLSYLSRPARAADSDDDSPWKPACARVKDVPFPAADQPDEAARKALTGCSSEALFYGIGQARDPAKARACAFVERAAGDGEVFGGSAILMTIYATGVGATRNPDLAIRLACAVEGAPAEIEGRVAHLEKLKSGKNKKPSFDLCDDITSGFMMGHCAAHDQRVQAAKRDQRYAARVGKWTAPERASFQKLRDAAGEFFHARSANEVDLSGTARAALQIEEEQTLEGAFGALLDALEKGTLAKANDADLARADRELNASYQRLMKVKAPGWEWGTVTTEGIREAERKWPKYRDAWAAFAKVKYPQIDAAAVKTRVTQERIGDLDAFRTDGKPPAEPQQP